MGMNEAVVSEEGDSRACDFSAIEVELAVPQRRWRGRRRHRRRRRIRLRS